MNLARAIFVFVIAASAAAILAGKIGRGMAQAPAIRTAIVVSSCGSASYPAGQFQPVTQDTNGKLCTKTCSVSLPVTYTPGVVYPVALDTDGQMCE